MARSNESIPTWIKTEINRINSLEGEARLAAMWSLAERMKDSPDAFELHPDYLRSLLRVAWKEGRFDYTTMGFGELRRLYATDPRYGDLRRHVLWHYKWIVEHLPEYADIPLGTINEISNDMENFYRAENESLRPVYSIRMQNAVLTGHKDEATVWFEKWQAEPHGESDDCPACEADRHIVYLNEMEQYDQAIEAANPIFNGKKVCDDTPLTIARLVTSASRAKKHDLAARLVYANRRMIRRHPHMLGAMASQVPAWLLVMRNPVRARRLAIVSLRRALDSRNDYHRFITYRSVGLWSALTLMVGLHDFTLPRRLMPNSPTATGNIPLAEASALCFAEAHRYATLLDTRNQTPRYSTQLEEAESTLRKALAPKGRLDT